MKDEDSMTTATQGGLFDPRGAYRRVNRETILLLGGASALLMQVAHPKIAAAVAAHSTYRERPLRRLFATVEAMQKIVFGAEDVALATVSRINDLHGRVSGKLDPGTMHFPTGTSYTATDPGLLLWVYATLTSTTLKVYCDLVHPLATADEASFYLESRQLAGLFGVPDVHIPADLDAFHAYMNVMLTGDELEISPTARSIARDIVNPSIRGIPHQLNELVRVPALAFLPPILRERYGFDWSPPRHAAWSIARRFIKSTLPFTPKAIRVNRFARRTERTLSN